MQEYRSHSIRNLYQRVKNLKGNYKKKKRFLKYDDYDIIVYYDTIDNYG